MHNNELSIVMCSWQFRYTSFIYMEILKQHSQSEQFLDMQFQISEFSMMANLTEES